MHTPDKIFPVFFAVWIAVGLGQFFFFRFNKDIPLKKRLFPRFAVGAGILFGLFILIMVPWPAALIPMPIIAAITWINIRMNRVCDACGKILINPQWWSKMTFCPYCGAKLS